MECSFRVFFFNDAIYVNEQLYYKQLLPQAISRMRTAFQQFVCNIVIGRVDT